ncbi:MAG: ABC transporter substrate-binding protein, partial [Candidatus Methanofastidiosia archaeon]
MKLGNIEMKMKITFLFLLVILFGNPFYETNAESEEDLRNYAIWVVTLNNNSTPLDNKLVRQAMNYAIDKEAIKEKYNSPGVVATGIIPPGMPGYRPNREELYPYNPSKAKELLIKAGYPNGFKVTIYKDRESQDDLVDIADYLERIGIDVEINERYSWDDIFKKANESGNIPMWSFMWVADWLYPDNFLDKLCKSGNPETNYKNEEIDDLLEQAKKTSDKEKQLELYQKAEDICVDDAPYIFLMFWGYFAEGYIEYEKKIGTANRALEKGKSLLEAGDIESAIERFESSLGIHSKFDKDKSRECDSLFKQTIESYMQFGNSLFDNGDFENAKGIYENLKDYIDDHLDLLYDANIVTSSILNEYEKICDE